jgi:hypothetical protein
MPVQQHIAGWCRDDVGGLTDRLLSLISSNMGMSHLMLDVCSAIVLPSGTTSDSSRRQTDLHAGGNLTSGAASRQDMPANCICCSPPHICHVRELWIVVTISGFVSASAAHMDLVVLLLW